MFQAIFEMPETSSIKDKRRIVNSLKERAQRKFHLSCAEIDLHESLRFAQLGAAIVSNSRDHGESVLRKAIEFFEDSGQITLHDFQLHSEIF